jgi:hypothetical protein
LVEQKNEELRPLNEAPLLMEEAFGARLYTGPMCERRRPALRLPAPGVVRSTSSALLACGAAPWSSTLPATCLACARRFQKYNDSLRGFGPTLASCKGNAYVTTIHAINSMVVKASKLTKVGCVYRGVSSGVLPDSFWTANKHGVRGGVERSFLSTTYDRAEAMRYASADDKPSVVFELQMGMVRCRAPHACLDPPASLAAPALNSTPYRPPPLCLLRSTAAATWRGSRSTRAKRSACLPR